MFGPKSFSCFVVGWSKLSSTFFPRVAGVKFNDPDLIGVPYQMILAEKHLKDGFVESKERRKSERGQIEAEKVIDALLALFGRPPLKS